MGHNTQLNFEILKISEKVGSSIKDFNSHINKDRIKNVLKILI